MATPAKDDPHPVDRHVGHRVAERRISLGRSQSDLGRAIGLTFQQVQKYEKGANRISASKLWEISRFLRVEIGYFFEGLRAEESGLANTGGNAAHPATRYSIEIGRLAPRLSTHQQKLALDLIANLVDGAAPDGVEQSRN